MLICLAKLPAVSSPAGRDSDLHSTRREMPAGQIVPLRRELEKQV